MSNVKHLDENSFEAETSKGVALIDFWAEWCGPCRMLGPIIDELADEVAGKAVVAKIDVDKSQSIAAKFSVRSIPAIFVLKDSAVVRQFVGVQDKKTLLDAINSALSKDEKIIPDSSDAFFEFRKGSQRSFYN
jgi:thioredoxin 1